MKYSENDAYIKAKRKLFHLIKNNNLIIVDQNDKQYNFTLTNKKDEFLNLEYPTSYKSKKAIGLNNYYPCLLKLIKDYEIDMPSKSCNKEAFTGYNETVPCLKCVKSNLTKSNIIFDYHSKHKNFFSFVPDISYGFEGEHKVWIEILHKHKCTPQKRSLAKMLGIKIIEISSYDILKLEGTVKYIDGQLITEMSKDEYQEFSSREVNSNLKEERKNKNVNKKLTGKIKKMSRKTFVELCFKEFKEEIDKMNNKLNSEGCYVKRKIDNYFLEKIKEIDQLNNCESEFELYIDYFYRSLGYSIITPSTYNISFLKASNIDYKEEDKIIISRELKDKLYIAHKR